MKIWQILRQWCAKSTPTVLQNELTDSGATALAILLAYWGRYISLEDLRLQFGYARDGYKMEDVIRVANLNGLDCTVELCSAEEFAQHKPPFIMVGAHNNYIIIERITNNKILINDPAMGPRKITIDVCAQLHSGMIIKCHKTIHFEKTDEGKFNLTKAMLEKLLPFKRTMIFLFLVGLFMVLTGIVSPILLQQFIDGILQQGNFTLAPYIIGGLLVTTGLQILFPFLEQRILLRFYATMAFYETQKFVRHLLAQPWNFFAGRAMGDISMRMHNNDEIAHIMVYKLAHNIIQLVKIAIFGLIIIVYDPIIAIPVLLINSLNFMVLMVVMRRLSDMAQRIGRETNELHAVGYNGIYFINSIKYSAMEHYFFEKWALIHGKTINTYQKMQFYSVIIHLTPILCASLSVIAILWVGGVRYLSGAITAGGIVAMMSLAYNLAEPLKSFIALVYPLQLLNAKLTDVNEVFANPVDKKFQSTEKPAKKMALTGSIQCDNCDFYFNPMNIISGQRGQLSQISLSIESGQRVGIWGGMGAGKTTLLKTLAGLYHHNMGQIIFDQWAIDDIPAPILAKLIIYIDQEIRPLPGSMRDNITMWQDEDENLLQQVCTHALLNSKINQSKLRTHSIIDERAEVLAHSEYQKMELARALYQKPKILLADNALSFCEPDSRLQIYQNIQQLGMTLVLTATDPIDYQYCDNIIILENGQITAQGQPEYLIKTNGEFAQFMGAKT